MTAPSIAEFIARQYDLPVSSVRVEVAPLHGGLESSVVRARIDASDRRVPQQTVVKELRGPHRREVNIYAAVHAHLQAPPSPRMLGVETGDDVSYLYLEDVDGAGTWPWADTALASEVCRVLARLHRSPLPSRIVDDWDYEGDLADSARSTLDLARSASDLDGALVWRRRGDLTRVVRALPSVRAFLSRAGFVAIHGDVHPGNVIVHQAGSERRVHLIDWARARYASPFEDVASWLHSLGCWEPEARRRHDTLLTAYLRAYATTLHLSAETRTFYWLAAACNGLSGAIRYHLAAVGDRCSTGARRASSHHALHAWERVIRRAASLLRAVD